MFASLDYFFQEEKSINAIFALEFADFFFEKVVDAKGALPPVTVFHFLVKSPGFCRIFKKLGDFF